MKPSSHSPNSPSPASSATAKLPAPAEELRKIKAQWANAQLLAEEEARNQRQQQQGVIRAPRSRRKPGAASEAELLEEMKKADGQKNTVKEKEFRVRHFGILGLLGWLLFVHLVGIYFFTKGFLLTRLVLENKSECDVTPFEDHVHGQPQTSIDGCWHPKSFDKAILLVIDALRYDFTVPFRPTVEGQQPHLFHNNIPVLHETAMQSPNNAFLLPFIADPPTTTLQRLKGLTTGTLPTFIDAGSNFAGTAIDEDNLIEQLRKAGKRVVHLGDDTWHALFPGYFEEELTHPYDSFNVWDLHTVDNGVNEHLFPLLHTENVTRWDVIFGHYLGVDHAGHRYGPDHAAMAAKLGQMDQVIRKTMEIIDDNTLLVVMGDHGMDSKGDHGGESDDEVEAALWMYSKKGIFGPKERSVPQIDLVPTLSLLLGLPIPFNNLGSPIEEAFAGSDGDDIQNLAAVNRLSSAQIKRYQHQYATVRGVDQSHTSGPLSLWSRAEAQWEKIRQSAHPTSAIVDKISSLRNAYDLYREYQRDTLDVCRALWARFDIPSMIQGIALLSAGILLLVYYSRAVSGNLTEMSLSALRRIGIGSVLGGLGGASLLTGMSVAQMPLVDGLVFGVAVGGIISAASTFLWLPFSVSSPLPNSVWSWMAVIFTVSQSAGFASNSYTIWEDQILLFFLTTFGVLAAVSSLRQKARVDKVLGFYHSVLFVILGRVASFSRLCREEQMPFCRSTYYASSTSSTSAPWQLFIPFFLSLVLPAVIKSFYQGTKSYEGSAVFWIGFALRIGLLISAVYWLLDAADDGDWFSMKKSTLKSIRVILAQIVLAMAFAAGTSTFAWAKPCVSIGVTPYVGAGLGKQSVTILGYANVYGTRYCLLLVNFALALILMQKPMGSGALGILVWQILSLLEILDTNGLSSSSSAIGPVILGLLGSFHFFTTGHQATLSSVQWESAFIPLSTVRYPWSPILVIFNTFGAQILSAVAVPLTVLWKRPIDTRSGVGKSSNATANDGDTSGRIESKKPPTNKLLADVAQAATTHILYYSTVNLATTMWAGWLRRHLMLYRIFCPRFMMGAAVLLVVDVMVFLAVGGVRWSTISVADIFGWA